MYRRFTQRLMLRAVLRPWQVPAAALAAALVLWGAGTAGAQEKEPNILQDEQKDYFRKVRKEREENKHLVSTAFANLYLAEVWLTQSQESLPKEKATKGQKNMDVAIGLARTDDYLDGLSDTVREIKAKLPEYQGVADQLDARRKEIKDEGVKLREQSGYTQQQIETIALTLQTGVDALRARVEALEDRVGKLDVEALQQLVARVEALEQNLQPTAVVSYCPQPAAKCRGFRACR